MEWYWTLNREGFSAEVVSRVAKVFIIAAALLIMADGVCSGRNPVREEGTERMDSAAVTPVSNNGTEMTEIMDLTRLLPLVQVPDTYDVNMTEDTEASETDVPLSDFSGDRAADGENTGPVIMTEDMMNISVNPGADRTSETAEIIISETVEKPDGGTDIYNDAESDPVPVTPEENSFEASVTENGFLVNESGMIYGIADPALIVTDGYMELPSEGCSGIAAGTFAAGFPEVREILIPSNITYIEEGAFAGLTNMEWYEMEPSGEYYTEEGVLFSGNGSCILAFPSGRTGTYKAPSCVERFAVGAFDSALLEAVDATDCSLGDTSQIPEYIALLTRETP